jgi:hypothetical protein
LKPLPTNQHIKIFRHSDRQREREKKGTINQTIHHDEHRNVLVYLVVEKVAAPHLTKRYALLSLSSDFCEGLVLPGATGSLAQNS